ncbi:hypothetical protein [Roseivirga sp. E12]|uniref:hypothetical protein n=1 Tax=Roseivirga sp. E12 TaxID=2819237 RepID=UPI001ABCD1A4|nr:hypothetical protein [Roseivirga sp. E12]MBO3698685.1 hypothetical protein [Roseivirga sp. E12]
MKRLTIFLALACAYSCQDAHHLSPLDIVGTWENTTLNVEVSTVSNSDSSSILSIDIGEWEKTLNIKPISTTYWADGTFVSVYRGLDGQEIGKEEGNWSIRNDSLILSSSNYNNAYRVTIQNEQARFVSYLDWDQDGSKDDLYDGWQIKVE